MNKNVNVKARNAVAVAAHFRKAASFAHKCAERGGSKNVHRDVLNENMADNVTNISSPFWETIEAGELESQNKSSSFWDD